jgi:diacylglycerol kinase family enzyme
LRFTAGAGDAGRLAAEIEPGRCAAVVSAGGDGTLNEVLNGLADPSAPLAMLPLGTANVLACELRLPRRPGAIAEMIAAGRTVSAAIGVAAGRRFLLFVGAGLDGAMVERVEQVRRGPLGKHRWLLPVLQVVWRLPRHVLAVETAEGERRGDLSEVLATRVRNYGGVMRMPGGMRIDDGLLHVICFRQRTRWAFFRAALRAALGRLRPGRDVEILETRALRIHCADPVPYQVDGDLGGRAPVDVRLDPVSARLLVPEEYRPVPV